jgi:hypothetical protein
MQVMADFERFEFTVPGYTPETMPLDRLIEYLNQLIVILGNPSDLHLVDIKKSSTKPVLVMPHHAAVKARQRARETWEGGGSVRQRTAYHRIRRMVADDGGKPAVLVTRDATILEFPSVDLGADQEISTLRQASSISGELLRVGGDSEFDQILLKDFSGEIISGCFASKDVAKNLATFLHDPVRLSGVASWQRDRTGKWQISRMKVQSFEVLERDGLENALVEAQRAVRDWPEDLTDTLLDMRKDKAA